MDRHSGHAPRLVLASGSPRRLELLSRLGLHPEVHTSQVIERWHPAEPVGDYVRRLAAEKAGAVAAKLPAGPRSGSGTTPSGASVLVVAADTAVVLDGEPLGKPVDSEHARWMLARLSGRTHQVMTAVAVVAAGYRPSASGASPSVLSDLAEVTFPPLSPELIEWYVSTREPRGKAGGYAIQGAGAVLVERVDGDPTTVIGLPLRRTAELLCASGFPVPGLSTP